MGFTLDKYWIISRKPPSVISWYSDTVSAAPVSYESCCKLDRLSGFILFAIPILIYGQQVRHVVLPGESFRNEFPAGHKRDPNPEPWRLWSWPWSTYLHLRNISTRSITDGPIALAEQNRWPSARPTTSHYRGDHLQPCTCRASSSCRRLVLFLLLFWRLAKHRLSFNCRP